MFELINDYIVENTIDGNSDLFILRYIEYVQGHMIVGSRCEVKRRKKKTDFEEPSQKKCL